jgi:hypothetical protein
MANKADPGTVPVLRLTADLPADVVSQLQELASLMNANRATALHEAIVLANLLYCEAARRGKVMVRQGSTQKVIYLPKVTPKLAESFGIDPGRPGIIMSVRNLVSRILGGIKKLLIGEPPISSAGPVPIVRLTADLPADVISQLQEVASLMNANRTTALHQAIVLTNLLYSEAAKSSTPGHVVVKQGGNEKVIDLPTVSPEDAQNFGIS